MGGTDPVRVRDVDEWYLLAFTARGATLSTTSGVNASIPVALVRGRVRQIDEIVYPCGFRLHYHSVPGRRRESSNDSLRLR